MSLFINKGNAGFASVLNSNYVDKSMLIEHVNGVMLTEARYLCVTRARRFGKSVAVKMLNAYYDQSSSLLKYNDENSLACVLSLAFYTARTKYTVVRELPSGKGFADIVLIPHRNVDSPAIVVELKWNISADTAVSQIRRKEYPSTLSHFAGTVLLVGINYNKKTKLHECQIERVMVDRMEPTINPPSTHHQPIINPPSNPNIVKLVAVMGSAALSTAELMSSLGIRDRVSFRCNYLNPALETGYVSMLYPDNPKRRGQKYMLTDVGKQLFSQQ